MCIDVHDRAHLHAVCVYLGVICVSACVSMHGTLCVHMSTMAKCFILRGSRKVHSHAGFGVETGS